MLREVGPVVPVEGIGHVLTTKAAAQECFRQPLVFSSAATANGTLRMGADRPLIPLQIDPPDHLQYRKILDPLFAPRKMAALEAPVSALVNELIDGFVDRGSCDFTARVLGPVPVAGVPDAAGAAAVGPPGLPHDEGRDHPARRGGGQEPRTPRHDRLPERDRRLHLRVLQRGARRPGGGAARRPAERLPRRGGRRPPADAPRHPRRLLPLPHRGSRHRERVTRLLLRLPVRAPGAAASCSSTTPRWYPARWRSCCGGRRR